MVKTYGFQILETDCETGFDLMNGAKKIRREERLWQLYSTLYPMMGEDNFMEFEDFMKYVSAPKEKGHTKEQIIANTMKKFENISFGKRNITELGI
ncbi:MAG: hypothetical protein J5811_02540 [Lachnospiraceae bacterium]|nr:hypothetical protein [Lachnospiraceae bacterium]